MFFPLNNKINEIPDNEDLDIQLKKWLISNKPEKYIKIVQNLKKMYI